MRPMSRAAAILWGACAVCGVTITPAENAPATTGVLEAVVGGKRTLVLAEGPLVKSTHSMFLDALEARGHELSFGFASSGVSVTLSRYGEYHYDNLVVFAKGLGAEKGGKGKGTEGTAMVTTKDIMGFIEGGGNLVMAGEGDMGPMAREVASLCGVDFDQKGSRVVDHFSFQEEGVSVEDSMGHTAIKTDASVESQLFLGPFSGKRTPVVFSGVGHATDDENYLVTKVLTASDTAYSAEPSPQITTYPENAGKDTLLVSAVQARNNRRVVFAGSISMFSNRFFLLPGSGNREFCIELSKWVFGERGILRASEIAHTRHDGTAAELLLKQKERRDLPASLFPEPEIAKNSQVYRIKDNVTYSLVIEEYDVEKGGWGPFSAEDVQMEFVMLDPFERITLDCVGKGRFRTTFTAPDTYGIFKFRVQYRRPGYSVLSFSTQVSIRPFKHNEYERFILTAYPYYASMLSVMVGFLVFSTFFLFSGDRDSPVPALASRAHQKQA